MNVGLTTRARKEILRLLKRLAEQQVSHRESFGTWSNADGSFVVGIEGYKTISAISSEIRAVESWRTYPSDYLKRLIAHAMIRNPQNPEMVLKSTEQTLHDGFGHNKAFVPLWGFHMDEGVVIDFGNLRVRQLGKSGFEAEIIEPLRRIRAPLGEQQVAKDVEIVTNDLKHIPNIPIVVVEYDGSAEGAREVVAPVAEQIASFLQFVAAWVIESRERVRIIEHRGAYFSRFDSIMPVVSNSIEMLEPFCLDTPNVRGYPYGPTVTAEDLMYLKSVGLLDLTTHVPSGPTRGNSTTAILLRATQLIADGERAVSTRQTIISYVGACDAMFGKADAAELYTCAGMAAASEQDFEVAFVQAEILYEARSEAAHRGVTPETLGPARRFALNSIRYLAQHKDVLTNKTAIRTWIEPHVARAERLRAQRRGTAP